VTFPSDQWLAALTERLASGQPRDPGSSGSRAAQLRLGIEVVTDPGALANRCEPRVTAYTIVVDSAEPPAVERGTEGADLVLRVRDTTAAAIGAGTITAAQAISAGEVKIHGDTKALTGASDLLEAVFPLVAGLGAPPTGAGAGAGSAAGRSPAEPAPATVFPPAGSEPSGPRG
jgi:hypothetical protein